MVVFVIGAAWFTFLIVTDQENVILASSRTGGTLTPIGGLLIVAAVFF